MNSGNLFDIYKKSGLTDRFISVLNMGKKYRDINLLKNEPFRNNFHSALDSHLYESIKLVLVEQYHHLKENLLLDGTSYSDRLNQFEEIIAQEAFCNHLLNDYPVLKKSIDSIVNDFFDTIIDILDNYKKDCTKIKKCFKQNYGQIISIDLNMGDKHNGRTVAKVYFENGTLYYKPKELQSDNLFNDLTDFMQHHKVAEFKKIQSFTGLKHSWQESIEHKGCEDIDEARAYYYRSGVLLSLMYVLRSYDMHHENVIAHGEYPIVIDTETLTTGGLLNNFDLNEGKGIESSILSSSMLPIYNDLYDINMSGLFTKQEELSEKIFYYTIEKDVENDLAFHKHPASSIIEKNAVYIDGTIVQPDEVIESLIEGFKKGSECIINNKKDFIGILQAEEYENIIVRQILRGTQVYYTFIKESNNPKILKNEDAYDQLFNSKPELRRIKKRNDK